MPLSGNIADLNSGRDASMRRIVIGTLFGLLILSAWIGLPFDLPYVGYGLASAFLFQVAIRPRRWEIIAVLLSATALSLFDQFSTHQGTAGFRPSACFGFLGLSSFALVGFRAIWSDADQGRELKSILLPAAGFTFFILGSQQLLNLAGMLFPNTADLYAYAFDGSLGFQPAFVVGSLFQKHPWIAAAGHFTYFLLPFPMALVCAAHLRRKVSSQLFMLEVFMAAGLFGYFLYLLFPATGPRYVAGPEFPGFPLPLAALRQLPLRMVPLSWNISRNAMPSLHATWALLIWFNCKPFSRLVRGLAFVFLLTTLLDTLGTGEHYLIDLVVAFPFAVAIQALCSRTVPWRTRIAPVVGGFALTMLWPLLLRYGTRVFLLTPAIPWIAIVATTILSTTLMRQIFKSELHPTPDTAPVERAIAAGI